MHMHFKQGWWRKFHFSCTYCSIERIIKRAGTTRTTSSIIKSGQKDTEASIQEGQVFVKVLSGFQSFARNYARHVNFFSINVLRGWRFQYPCKDWAFLEHVGLGKGVFHPRPPRTIWSRQPRPMKPGRFIPYIMLYKIYCFESPI